MEKRIKINSNNGKVQKEKNPSRGANSRKTQELNNDLNDNSIILRNLDYVKFGQVENTITEEDLKKNYGKNIIGDYVRELDGKLYKDIRKEFTSSTDLFNYILYNRGGRFVKGCYKWRKENNVDFELGDLLQTMFAIAFEYAKSREFNENGEFYDGKDIIVNDVLAYVTSNITNAFIREITRKNNINSTTQNQIKNLNKFRKYARELEDQGVNLDKIDMRVIQKDLNLSYEELEEILHMVRGCKSLDDEIDDGSGNPITVIDTVASIEEGFNRVDDNFCFDITDEDYGALNLPLSEVNNVDRSVIYLYKTNKIDELKMDIYKSDREFHTKPRREQGVEVRVDNKILSEKYKCSSNKIYKNRKQLEGLIRETCTEVLGGESLE